MTPSWRSLQLDLDFAEEKWQNRRICETLKTPEEMQAKKDSLALQLLRNASCTASAFHIEERWKAHYKTLREERKKQKAEDRLCLKNRRLPQFEQMFNDECKPFVAYLAYL